MCILILMTIWVDILHNLVVGDLQSLQETPNFCRLLEVTIVDPQNDQQTKKTHEGIIYHWKLFDLMLAHVKPSTHIQHFKLFNVFFFHYVKIEFYQVGDGRVVSTQTVLIETEHEPFSFGLENEQVIDEEVSVQQSNQEIGTVRFQLNY